ncbi:histone methyltransferase set2 [Steccherinum ochraceum]|uniref:[histone H3]-lysine(36) N-trimethyltransferase n=1 Tax=Steccherinum ochraceum TaxID=92696 RepID=A0A4R0RFW7_9APHY|nr:histone methyltransferase set2 [Steccherinum ochraceum]
MSSRSSSSMSDRSGRKLRSASGSREGTYTELLEDNGVKDEAVGLKEDLEDVAKEEDEDVLMEEATSPTLNGSTVEETKSEVSDVKMEDAKPRKSVSPPTATTKSKVKPEPQLIGDLPRAEENAFKTFEELPRNHYQYGVDDPSDACGDDSDCINRLTQVECLPDDCKCRSFCGNQRFQKREYADIHIVQTEKKGFGLRAGADLPKYAPSIEPCPLSDSDSLGTGISSSHLRVHWGCSQPTNVLEEDETVRGREEGIRHFYFMMLQKDEYIDATKRGGMGRFANHSCNPNCYVAKWTVGEHVRMGIFANRRIKKDEELTFNYNVDRYGHDAQICYCGEPNCVGFIGGKTQTDIAAMDDLYLDALGITEEVEQLGLKGSKKKKGKKLDATRTTSLAHAQTPTGEGGAEGRPGTPSNSEPEGFVQAIDTCQEQSALRQIMRLRGFSVMTNILEDYSDDIEILTVAVECMMTWPLIQRNKVEDSKVNVPVKVCSESENENLASLSKKLLEQWEGLEYAYRIPKRVRTAEEIEKATRKKEKEKHAIDFFHFRDDFDTAPMKKRKKSPPPAPTLNIRPAGRRSVTIAPVRSKSTVTSLPLWIYPPEPSRPPSPTTSEPFTPLPTIPLPPFPRTTIFQFPAYSAPSKSSSVAAIIAEASAAAAAASEAASAAAAAAEAEKVAKAEEAAKRKEAKARSKHHKHQSKEEKEANKEKRLLKLVGAVVVKVMSKYQHQIDHDSFKKHAKELTQIITEKEKKSNSYREGKLDSLSEEKVVKIKKFAKDYIAKVLRRAEKKHKSKTDEQDNSPGSSSMHMQYNDAQGSSRDAPLSLADVVDMDDHEEDGEDEHSERGDVSPEDQQGSGSAGPSPPESMLSSSISDPRMRHLNEESGWDPTATASISGPSDLGLEISC